MFALACSPAAPGSEALITAPGCLSGRKGAVRLSSLCRYATWKDEPFPYPLFPTEAAVRPPFTVVHHLPEAGDSYQVGHTTGRRGESVRVGTILCSCCWDGRRGCTGLKLFCSTLRPLCFPSHLPLTTLH